MSKPALQFGLNAALPDGITTAWGARLIFPADLLHDRQLHDARICVWNALDKIQAVPCE